MTVRKCLHCFKRIPEVDGACPHCGKPNTSVASNLLGGSLLLIVGGILVGILVLMLAFWDWIFSGELFEYRTDVIYEVTSDDDTTARIVYYDAEMNRVEIDNAVLPVRFRVKDVPNHTSASVLAIPHDKSVTVHVRIFAARQKRLIAEGQNFPGVQGGTIATVASADGYVSEEP